MGDPFLFQHLLSTYDVKMPEDMRFLVDQIKDYHEEHLPEIFEPVEDLSSKFDGYDETDGIFDFPLSDITLDSPMTPLSVEKTNLTELLLQEEKF